jgi:hypothetical protein
MAIEFAKNDKVDPYILLSERGMRLNWLAPAYGES